MKQFQKMHGLWTSQCLAKIIQSLLSKDSEIRPWFELHFWQVRIYLRCWELVCFSLLGKGLVSGFSGWPPVCYLQVSSLPPKGWRNWVLIKNCLELRSLGWEKVSEFASTVMSVFWKVWIIPGSNWTEQDWKVPSQVYRWSTLIWTSEIQNPGFFCLYPLSGVLVGQSESGSR